MLCAYLRICYVSTCLVHISVAMYVQHNGGVTKRWMNEFPSKLLELCSIDVSAFVFERH